VAIKFRFWFCFDCNFDFGPYFKVDHIPDSIVQAVVDTDLSVQRFCAFNGDLRLFLLQVPSGRKNLVHGSSQGDSRRSWDCRVFVSFRLQFRHSFCIACSAVGHNFLLRIGRAAAV
jgi:hypothetical protein